MNIVTVTFTVHERFMFDRINNYNKLGLFSIKLYWDTGGLSVCLIPNS